MKPLQNPNIIMIVVDAARADYFSCYGFPEQTTPNIDRLAKKGTLFENVISTAPWTVPSHGSIFTSLYPSQHKATWETLRLKEGIPTIFDIFTERGYDAVAVSANSLIISPYNMFGNKTKILNPISHNNPDISSFAGNFDYRTTDSQHISQCLINYIERESLDKPQIIYLNFYDLHAKYKAREPFYSRYVTEEKDKTLKKMGDFYNLHFKEMNNEVEITEDIISALRASYAARLAMIDSDLGRVFDKLEESGLLDNSIIVITSDHGDVLGDHRRPSFHHQFSIYNSLLKIPLIFYWKGIKLPKRIKVGLIQNTDILPTILELCGMENPPLLNNSPGIALNEYIFNSNNAPPRKYAISMYECPTRFILRNKKKIDSLYFRNLMAIQDTEYKLIFSDKGDTELYYIKEDEKEKKNIANKFPSQVAELKKAFYKILAKYNDSESGQAFCNNSLVDNRELSQRLKVLGYME